MASDVRFFLAWCFGLARAETHTNDKERACLAKYAQGRRRLVEIGVWHAVTMSQLLERAAPDAVYFAVDPYFPGRFGFSTQRIIAKWVVRHSGRGRVVWIRRTGEEAASHSLVRAAPIDFLFIDGDHSFDGLKRDWESWRDLLTVGGIVGLHDSIATPEYPIGNAGSVRYTSEVINRDARYEVVDSVDTLTVFRRTC